MASKYDLELVAGNFFVTEFKPCVDDFLAEVVDVPDYVNRAIVKANIVCEPCSGDHHQCRNQDSTDADEDEDKKKRHRQKEQSNKKKNNQTVEG